MRVTRNWPWLFSQMSSTQLRSCSLVELVECGMSGLRCASPRQTKLVRNPVRNQTFSDPQGPPPFYLLPGVDGLG